MIADVMVASSQGPHIFTLVSLCLLGQVIGMCGCDLDSAPAMYNEARLADVHAMQVRLGPMFWF